MEEGLRLVFIRLRAWLKALKKLMTVISSAPAIEPSSAGEGETEVRVGLGTILTHLYSSDDLLPSVVDHLRLNSLSRLQTTSAGPGGRLEVLLRRLSAPAALGGRAFQGPGEGAWDRVDEAYFTLLVRYFTLYRQNLP